MSDIKVTGRVLPAATTPTEADPTTAKLLNNTNAMGQHVTKNQHLLFQGTEIHATPGGAPLNINIPVP